MDKIKIWSEIVGIWATVLGGFTAGGFALFEYHEKSEAERVKVTLEYIDRFYKDPLHTSWSKLNQYWNPKAETIFERTKAGEQELSKYIIENMKDSKLSNEVDYLVVFFESLRACTCAELCSENTVKKFFGKYSFDLYGLTFPYLEEQRNKLKDDSYGYSIESFAKSYQAGNSACKANSALNSDALRAPVSWYVRVQS